MAWCHGNALAPDYKPHECRDCSDYIIKPRCKKILEYMGWPFELPISSRHHIKANKFGRLEVLVSLSKVVKMS